MRHFMLAATAAILLGGALSAAAGGVIQLKDGKSNAAYDIVAETVSGVIWESEKDRAGTKVQLWDLDNVQYKGQAMDEYNSLGRKLAGGRGAPLAKDAREVITMQAPAGFDEAQWARIKLSAQYYEAMASYLDANWTGAISALEDYIEACEAPAALYDKNVVQRVSFTSKISGKAVTNGGGLNRFYLDALETLGMAYIKSGDAKSANEKAFQPLIVLTEALATNSGSKKYFNWAIRALRASAENAESAKDYAGARESYVTLRGIAVKQGGEESRAVYEAKLKIGFMQILEGDARGAQANFSEAIKDWKANHKSERTAPPSNDWINPDRAYLTAGSFLGQGLVVAATAKKVEEWAEALEHFSTSLAIFNADDEVRSKALLGAANASAKLAELGKAEKIVAQNYAVLAEKYLSELTSLLPKTKAAEDESIAGIQKIINAYKGD
jgi:hypothetical protein